MPALRWHFYLIPPPEFGVHLLYCTWATKGATFASAAGTRGERLLHINNCFVCVLFSPFFDLPPYAFSAQDYIKSEVK
jgi:hypothetical protein